MQFGVQEWEYRGAEPSCWLMSYLCVQEGTKRPARRGRVSESLQEGQTVGSAGAIKGSHVGELPRKSRQYANDRICAHPGCITKISRYNRRETCFAHAGVKIPRLRGRKVASV